MVLSVLKDGIPRTVRQITNEATKAAGAKQSRDSLNVTCSKLRASGILARPAKGVYQKVC